MQQGILKRSVRLNGRWTSVSLETKFWESLKEIAEEQEASLSSAIEAVNTVRESGNLSSAIRLFILDHYRQKVLACSA